MWATVIIAFGRAFGALLIGLLSSSFLACSSAEGPAPSTSTPLTRCVPHQTLVCLCGLDEGTQTCTAEGALTPCECEAPVTATPPPAPPPDAGPLRITQPERTCGNGELDPGEACDDGNSVDGDGCSATCVPDGAPLSASSCPGQPVHVWKGTPVTVAGSTAGFAHKTAATCWNATGPERVYALRPQSSGILTVHASFATKFYAVVSVRTGDCALTASEILCEDTLSKPFERVLSVDKGKTYHLIVDGDDATAAGAFAVRLELL